VKIPGYVSSEFIRMVLKEDIGRGDLTTELTFGGHINGTGTVRAKEDLILCGIDLAGFIFKQVNPELNIEVYGRDGSLIKKGDKILKVRGVAGSVLTSERVVLNFLQRLSGIATLTSLYVAELAEGVDTKIVDTRKTTPGWRTLEKYAVRVGGALNHRFGLDDGIMIKDNHIEMAGSIEKAVKAVRAGCHHLLKIEVEVTNINEVQQALDADADVIMLDNMSVEMMKRAVKLIGTKAVTEISGGVRLDKIKELSLVGADFISVGALTHSAVAKDIDLTLKTRCKYEV